MEDKYNLWPLAAVIFAVVSFFLWLNISTANAEKESLEDEIYSLEQDVQDLKLTIDEANSRIEDANREIEDAQFATWSDYQAMGSALESLDTVETVSY